MGILESILGSVWNTETKDWMIGQIDHTRIKAPFASHQQLLSAGKKYVNVMLRSMRIPYTQKATSKYFGAVHSYIATDHPVSTENAFHVFTAPKHLQSLDAANLDRVVQIDQRLFGPTPYYGGDLRLEMALFSVKSADLAAPYVNLLESVSSLAGTAFAGPAASLLPVLRNGVKLLSDTPGATTLEIGIDRTLVSPASGCYVAVRATMEQAPIEKYGIRQDGKLVDDRDNPVTSYPYLVFTIEETDNRRDWAKIPDVGPPYETLLQAARKGNQTEAASLFEELKRRVRLSLDVIPADAEEIIGWVEDQLKRAFPGRLQSRHESPEPSMASLENLPLYQR